MIDLVKEEFFMGDATIEIEFTMRDVTFSCTGDVNYDELTIHNVKLLGVPMPLSNELELALEEELASIYTDELSQLVSQRGYE